MAEPEKIEHPVGRRGQPGVAPADQAREHGALVLLARQDQVLAHGQLRKDLQQLEGAAHAEPVEIARPHAGDRAAVEMHVAGARPQLPEDAVEQGRLAAAVGADDAENLALVDLERHAVDGDDAAEALSEIVHGEDGAHRAPSRCVAASAGPAPSRPGGRLEQAIDEAEQARRAEHHQDDHQQRIAHEIEPFREAQPLRQQHRHDRAEEGAEEIAGAADHDHQQQIERQPERKRRRIDELHQRRVERAGNAAEPGAERKRHQRVAAGVDAERQRAHRIFAQRHEGAAPGRADQPPGGERHQREMRKTEIVEFARDAPSTSRARPDAGRC